MKAIPHSMLSEQAIEKYRAIYQKEFGAEISHEEAAKQAQRLLNIARVVFQPMPKGWLERYNKLLKEHLDDPRMDTLCPDKGYQAPTQPVEERLPASPLEK